jgi:hypothetical protein
MEMKRTTSVALVGTVVALALTQMNVLSVVLGAAIGCIGYALMPRETIQR